MDVISYVTYFTAGRVFVVSNDVIKSVSYLAEYHLSAKMPSNNVIERNNITHCTNSGKRNDDTIQYIMLGI